MPHTSPAGTENAPPRGRRRDPKGTRERLVRAALDLFTTQGFHESTTPQVARRAGVAEGTIYRHFASKDQLLNEIYREALGRFGGILREIPPAGACRARMAEIAMRWSEVAADDPALVRLVFVSPPTTLLDDESHRSYQALHAELEKVVASGKSSGEVRPGPAYLWTDVWLQLVRLMLERISSREWAPTHSAPQQVTDSAWDAIAAPVKAGSPSPES